MLFRALLTRMCRLITGSNLGFGGASGSEPGARISFQKYPGLTQLLSSLLASSGANQDGDEDAVVTERVFPALELIGEKVPTYAGPDEMMLRQLVREQLKSPVWGIREHAARVYASLLDRSDILGEIRALLCIDQDVKTQNFVHGKVLCVRFSLRRLTSSSHLDWNSMLHSVTLSPRNPISNEHSTNERCDFHHTRCICSIVPSGPIAVRRYGLRRGVDRHCRKEC